jgi:murein DD-endopeptidase MepM/ murein hydrolase activator NlpD
VSAWRALLAIVALTSSAAAQQYRFPLEASSGTAPYVTAYRDHDTGGGLLDYNCGSDTYNGHKGTDFGIGGFPVMNAGSRVIVAAAPGNVVFVNDGCFDQCTTSDCGCGSGFGNYVKIAHADGKSTYYAHMMNGSILVSLGDQVQCGQPLGKVGSSGNSSGPHVHFEPRYSDNVSDDPYAGGCGGPTSFWVNQGAYQGLPGDQCETPQVDVDDATIVSETLPDGSIVAPGASFEKSWTVENTGTTSWTKAGGYLWTHDGEETFSAPLQTELGDAESIAPGQQKSWTLSLVAPTTPGVYRGYFRMDHYGVARFGAQAHVEIEVQAGAMGDAGWPPDGAGGSGWAGFAGGGSAGSSANGGSSGSSQATRVLGDDGGCGCRLHARGADARLLALGLALAFGGWAARRRRRGER